MGVGGTIASIIHGNPRPAILLVSLVLCPMAGFLWGHMFWQHIEEKFRAAQAADLIEKDHQALTSLANEVRELRKALQRQQQSDEELGQ